tara:strand:- start:647 stop:865 length:219 start_codon:yes stop_codon:yes gene_type:complete
MQIPWYFIIPKLKSLVVKDMVADDMVELNLEDDIAMEPMVEDNAVNHSDYSTDYMTCFMNGNEGCEVLLYDD